MLLVSVGACDLHEAEHAVVHEVRLYPANYEIGAGLAEDHGLDPVLRQRPRIDSPEHPIGRIIDKGHWRRRDHEVGVDVAGLRPVPIDNRLVESADDEVDCAPCLDLDHLGEQLVIVTGSVVWVGEPVQWGVRLPLAEADGGLLPPLAGKPSAERQAFLQGLHEIGYYDGRNIAIETDRPPGIVNRCRSSRPNLNSG